MCARKVAFGFASVICIIALAMPSISLAWIAPMSAISHRCHGHSPAGNASHTCCYPRQPLPTAPCIASHTIATAHLDQLVVIFHEVKSETVAPIPRESGSSPPVPTALRI